MKRVYFSVLLTFVIYPQLASGYNYTISNADIRNTSYSAEQITQNAYNTAIGANASAPVFYMYENSGITYYKWNMPNFISSYTTSTDWGVFADFNQGNGSMSYLSVNNSGNVTNDNIYYASLSATNNRYEINDWSAHTPQIMTDFIGITNNNVLYGGGGAAIDVRYGTLDGIVGNFIGNTSASSPTGSPDFFVYGGALYNQSYIGYVTGDFIHNAINDHIAYGGAVYNSGTVNQITGDFVNNAINLHSFSGTEVLNISGNGGAIYNNGTLGSITGNFVKNSINGISEEGASAQGGAIYNNNTIDSITGDFVNNTIDLHSSADYDMGVVDENGVLSRSGANVSGSGGAINNIGTINSITGDFIGNTINVSGGSFGYAAGGAIYNVGNIENLSGNFIGNKTNASTSVSDFYGECVGGAIYNIGNINSVTGNFIANSADNGSAIYNYGMINSVIGDFTANLGNSTIYNGGTINTLTGNFKDNANNTLSNGGTIDTISGNFVNNHSSSIYNGGTINSINSNFNGNNSYYGGAAINNYGTVDSVVGNFNNNIANTNDIELGGSYGGAIYNGESGILNSVSGNFNNNVASFYGGAIFNLGTIRNLNSNFTGNDARFEGFDNYLTYGGAIYNNGTIDSINGDFVNNSAFLHGGAIYNDGTINSLTGNFNGNNIRGNLYGGNKTITERGTGGAIYNTGTIKMQGTVNFMTNSDDIHNNGEIYTINGTSDSSMNLYLQSVRGNGNFYLTDYTKAYMANNKTIEQDVFNISEHSSLTTFADSIKNIKTLNNNGTIYLTGGNLSANNIIGSGTVVITGDVTNTSVFNNAVNISNNFGAKLTTNADLFMNNSDIINNGTLDITGGTLYNNVNGGRTIIRNNAALYSLNVNDIDMNGIWNIGDNHVHASNANINGYINMTINNISKDSNEHEGGTIIADTITFGDNNKALFIVHENNLNKHESSGDLTIIDADHWLAGSSINMLKNNRYDIVFNESNHTFKITLNKTLEEFLQENDGSANMIAVANAWKAMEFSNNSLVQNLQELLDISSQYDIAEYMKILNNTAPNDTDVVAGNSRTVNSSIDNQVSDRLSFVGRSGGDVLDGVGIWGQGMYNHSSQSGDNEFSGNTFGFSLGADKKIKNNIILGLGYSLSKTSAKSGDRDIDALGHTMFAYGEYRPYITNSNDRGNTVSKMLSSWYLKAMLSYGFTNYKEVAGYGISSEYDTNTLGLNMDVGYGITKNTDLFVGARYLNISQNDYTDSLGQKVSVKDDNIITARVGGKYTGTNRLFAPTAHLELSYDVKSDDRLAIVNIGSSNYQISVNSLNPFAVQTGLGFISDINNWNLSLNYDLEWRPEFISHTGRFKVKYVF